MRELTKGNL